MGDVVQTLPALTDAAKVIAGISFDWVVDESFAQVPAWHDGVEKVFPSALRRWGANPKQAIKKREARAFLKRLRAREYDLVVDLQGEWKSATITRLARGPRFGYDRASVHEWGAQLAYQKRFFVPKPKHSLQRMRQLMAQALGYSFSENEVDYGVDRTRLGSVPLALSQPYLVFVHGTSWKSKCWPESYWQDLATKATNAGFSVVLPWGTEPEYQRAVRIAANHNKAVVLPKLSISEKASVLSQAVATVGLDTGLSHIAAALDIPSVTMYGATDPFLVGATGKNQIRVASDFECVKCHQVQCTYPKPAESKPACFVNVRPEKIWSELQRVMNGKSP